MSIWNYADRLPSPPPAENRLTLGEGGTPLVPSRSIGASLGLRNLFFKLESVNPTGSYKDRFAAAAISHLLAKQNQTRLCLGTSSGNTGAALAAYAAAAGLPCVLAIVDGAPEAKLQQMLAYGARLTRIRGFGTDAAVTREIAGGLLNLASELGTDLQISAFRYAPLGMDGVRTVAWEIDEDLPHGVDHVFAPAGGGGLALAVARGFESSGSTPAVHCVQPGGNDTIATPLREGASRARPCECTTAVSGLQVASVIDGHDTLSACRASGGTGYCVDDNSVFEFQKRLAAEEGIFAEPAAAVALAGAAKSVANGELDPASTVVCLVTGSGFKDAPSVARMNRGRDCAAVDSFAEFEILVHNTLQRRS